jgi:KilA-N domain
MYELIISDVAIRQDAEGRFCLNDLHKAAVLFGSNKRTKEPAKFLASPQIIDLITELETTQNLGSLPVNKIEGRNGGTYVVKELVYAYAMWINAAFHVKVIRAYDTLMTREVPEHIVKAYEELVANKIPEYLKIITSPLSVIEFEERYRFHETALESLKNAEVIMPAREFLKIKQTLNTVQSDNPR